MVSQSKWIASGGQTRQVTWTPDLAVVGNRIGWAGEYPNLLVTDMDTMARDFPTWFLVFGSGNLPVACQHCGEYIVPKDGTIRCVACEHTYTRAVSTILWVGQIPVLISGADRVEQSMRRCITRGALRIGHLERQGSLYAFAPIRAVYPDNWPNAQPLCFYGVEFLDTLGLERELFGHSSHMLGAQRMCLFNEWRRMGITEVIKNRIVPHAVAMVKIANGERPDSRWFNT